MIDTTVSLPEHVERPAEAVTQFVIFDHPLDFPSGYVLRPQFSVKYSEGIERFGTITENVFGPAGRVVVMISPIAWYAKTPDELRSILPPGVVYLGRMPGDDPKILEVWMDTWT